MPVKVGDVLKFKFGAEPISPHGITTRLPADFVKVQKRGDAANDQVLQELGTGDTRFGIKIFDWKPDEEMTQLQVLPKFTGALDLRCAVHSNMRLVVTLTP